MRKWIKVTHQLLSYFIEPISFALTCSSHLLLYFPLSLCQYVKHKATLAQVGSWDSFVFVVDKIKKNVTLRSCLFHFPCSRSPAVCRNTLQLSSFFGLVCVSALAITSCDLFRWVWTCVLHSGTPLDVQLKYTKQFRNPVLNCIPEAFYICCQTHYTDSFWGLNWNILFIQNIYCV